MVCGSSTGTTVLALTFGSAVANCFGTSMFVVIAAAAGTTSAAASASARRGRRRIAPQPSSAAALAPERRVLLAERRRRAGVGEVLLGERVPVAGRAQLAERRQHEPLHAPDQ